MFQTLRKNWVKTAGIVGALILLLLVIATLAGGGSKSDLMSDSNLQVYQDSEFSVKVPQGYTATKNILSREVVFEYKDTEDKTAKITIQKYLPVAQSSDVSTLKKLYSGDKDNEYSIEDLSNNEIGFVVESPKDENVATTYIFKGSSIWKIVVNDQDSSLSLAPRSATIVKSFSLGQPKPEENKRLGEVE